MQGDFVRKVVVGLMLGISLLATSPQTNISEASEQATAKPNSNCRTIKRWKNKGALGAALPGQNIIHCRKQSQCGAALCAAKMTCAGALN